MRKIRRSEYESRMRIYNISICISITMLLIGILVIMGIVGHLDYITEMCMVDDWSSSDYILRSFLAIVITSGSAFIGSKSMKAKQYYKITYRR